MNESREPSSSRLSTYVWLFECRVTEPLLTANHRSRTINPVIALLSRRQRLPAEVRTDGMIMPSKETGALVGGVVGCGIGLAI